MSECVVRECVRVCDLIDVLFDLFVYLFIHLALPFHIHSISSTSHYTFLIHQT